MENLFVEGRGYAEAQCNNFPQSNQSAILPQLYLNKFVEAVDPVTKLPVKRANADEQQYFELCKAQKLEQEKRRVFEFLNARVQSQPAEPLLVLCDFNWSQNTFDVLSSKFPWISNKIDDFCEMHGINHVFSFLVLQKNVSAVNIEVNGKRNSACLQLLDMIFNAIKTRAILNIMKNNDSLTIKDFTTFVSMMMLTLPMKSIFTHKDQFETQWRDLLTKLEYQVCGIRKSPARAIKQPHPRSQQNCEGRANPFVQDGAPRQRDPIVSI